MKNVMLKSVSLVAVMAAAAGASADVRYTATFVPNLPDGLGSIAGGVNDLGWIVGQASNGFGELVAFVYANGQMTELPMLAGGSEGYAHSVNNAGTIVGECRDAGGVSRPVKWTLESGVWTITDLGTLDSLSRGFGVATRISANGSITGYASSEGPGSYHAFKIVDGVMSDVGTLGYSGSLAYSQGLGINDAGHVSGYAYRVLGGPEHGMFVGDRGGEDITPAERFGLAQWHAVTSSDHLAGYVSGNLTSGHFTPAIYVPGEGITLLPGINGLDDGFGYDMNDAGTVVGTNFVLNPVPEPNVYHAFVYSNGVTIDLNDATDGVPGVITEAVDVSEGGLIAAMYDNGAFPTAIVLAVINTCPADFNGDGFADGFDYDDYVACFEGDPCPPGKTADFNGDGFADGFDYDDFVAAFESGCD